jgi:hypothetical protein
VGSGARGMRVNKGCKKDRLISDLRARWHPFVDIALNSYLAMRLKYSTKLKDSGQPNQSHFSSTLITDRFYFICLELRNNNAINNKNFTYLFQLYVECIYCRSHLLL